MLTLRLYHPDLWDEKNEVFVIDKIGVEVQFEHSLVSLSKWESEYEKPFLGEAPKTPEEAFGYVAAMVLTPDLPEEVLTWLTEEDLTRINDYMNAKQTATWFTDNPHDRKRSTETITAELIYYWMDELHINWEAKYWHLNKLFTLIKVHSAKQQQPKKMSRAEASRRMHEINARRRAELGTSG